MKAKAQWRSVKTLSLLRGLERQRTEMALAAAMGETRRAEAAASEAASAAALAQAGWRRAIEAGGPAGLTTARLWAVEARGRDAQRRSCDEAHGAAQETEALRKDEAAAAQTHARSIERRERALGRRCQALREEAALAELSDRFTRLAPIGRRT